MTSLLDYVLSKPSFANSYHVESADGKKYNAVLTDLPNQQYYQIKSPQGFPYDRNVIGKNGIYQSLTEGKTGWDDPYSIKQFISKTYSEAQGGIFWLPLDINPTPGIQPFSPVDITPDSTYREFSDQGKTITVANLGGPVSIAVLGPIKVNFGGTLGFRKAICQLYNWGSINTEVNYYAKGIGLVNWELWTSGKLVNQSLMNYIVAGGTPKLVDPLGVPTI